MSDTSSKRHCVGQWEQSCVVNLRLPPTIQLRQKAKKEGEDLENLQQRRPGSLLWHLRVARSNEMNDNQRIWKT